MVDIVLRSKHRSNHSCALTFNINTNIFKPTRTFPALPLSLVCSPPCIRASSKFRVQNNSLSPLQRNYYKSKPHFHPPPPAAAAAAYCIGCEGGGRTESPHTPILPDAPSSPLSSPVPYLHSPPSAAAAAAAYVVVVVVGGSTVEGEAEAADEIEYEDEMVVMPIEGVEGEVCE